MASIVVRNASVEIPVFAVGNNSLKSTLLRRAVGGRFGHEGSNLIVNAVSGVSFEAHDGDRIGLIGHNGAGKTTLLRVLAGVYPPTKGTVEIAGHISPMFSISLGMTPDATGIENIRMCGTLWGLSKAEIQNGFDDIAEFTELGEYLNIPVRTYSAGMLARLAFAIATLRSPEILLLDEVIGVGDATFRAKAEERMRKMMGSSQILVVSSHADSIIKSFCNKVIWMDKGNMMRFGPVDEVLGAYRQSLQKAKPAPAAPEKDEPAASDHEKAAAVGGRG